MLEASLLFSMQYINFLLNFIMTDSKETKHDEYDPFDGKPVDLTKYYRILNSQPNKIGLEYCSVYSSNKILSMQVSNSPSSQHCSHCGNDESTFTEGIKGGGLSLFGLGSSEKS